MPHKKTARKTAAREMDFSGERRFGGRARGTAAP